MNNLIKIDSLTLGYESKPIVENISFCVNSGDYLCIIGDNGAGKSTLLKTILSLHKPLSGSVEFSSQLTRSDIGYLAQAKDIQKDFPASVYEIVISGALNKCGLRPFFGRVEQKLARESMDRLGISSLSKRCFRELSGGQQQRVLLARALCASNKLIVLDEPAAGLDPDATIEMYDSIQQLNREFGLTIIMVSHDICAAQKYASHILRLQNGGAVMIQKGGQHDNI